MPLVWNDPWREVAPGGHQYAVGEHPGSGWTWSETLVPREALRSVVARVGNGEFGVAGLLAVEALRIAAWRPRFATEVDEKTIPHELDWLRTAVHLTKGCYRGQETVAKVHNLGHPPRRLVMLHLDGSEGVLPARGSVVSIEVAGERRAVGLVTSSALHHELGPIALAVVKRSTDPDATLLVEADELTLAAAQVIVVPPGAGAEGARSAPATARRRHAPAALTPGEPARFDRRPVDGHLAQLPARAARADRPAGIPHGFDGRDPALRGAVGGKR